MRSEERYADTGVRAITGVYNGAYVHCSRTRCRNLCWLENVADATEITPTWRFYDTVIIVSLDGGRVKRAYCTERCASLDMARS